MYGMGPKWNIPSKPSPVKVKPKIRRNVQCPCGSGIKYKHCCLNKS